MAYAVVTGASSGIGKEFAYLLASKGYDLILIARRDDILSGMSKKLKEKYRTACTVIKADLSREDEVIRCTREIDDHDIDVFINNAGLGEAGRFRETDLKKELFMIDVNIRAVHIFAKYMVKYFMRRGRGYLLNVASSAGLLPAGPYMAAYYATKSYVVSLTKAISVELRDEGCHVYAGCLCPGPVDTGFNEVANVKFALPGISPRECVRYAYKKMMKRQKVIIPSFLLQAAVFAQRLVPWEVTAVLTASQQKKKKGL